MGENNRIWFNHLENSIPKSAYGYKLCSYLLALEGWRRGLTLKYVNRKGRPEHIELSNGEKTYIFNYSRPDIIPISAIRVCINKEATKEHLRAKNIPVPEGEFFDSEADDKDILDYSSSIGFPLVIKPFNAGGGIGVISNIRNEQEMADAINNVRHQLGYKEVIVEKYITGEDYRVFVLDGRILGAFHRMPANILGDGKNTIEELIKRKNVERKKSPFIYFKPIKINNALKDYLKKKDMTLETIPAEGKRIFLKNKGDFANGGDPIDITDSLSEKVREVAIGAAQSVPGLIQCAVDLIVDEDKNEVVVNELNSKAQISNHLFPLEGVARDVPKAIIDYYFPETVDTPKATNYYFNFDIVNEGITKGLVEEIKIKPIQKQAVKEVYLLKGDVKTEFENHLKLLARTNFIDGFARHLVSGDMLLVIVGKSAKVNKFMEELIRKNKLNSEQLEISEHRWSGKLQVGFKIQKSKKLREKEKNEKKALNNQE